MKVKVLILFTITTLLCGFLLPTRASATDYGTVNILDDAIMNNTGSISAAQINALLNSYPGSCLSSNGGFTTTDPLGYSSGAYQYGGSTDAGTAIYHIATHYNLNPQVLIATLEKEQGLIDGTSCHPEHQGDAPAYYSWSNHAACTGAGNPYADCVAVTCGGGTNYTNCSYACRYSGGCATVAIGYACPGFCKKTFATFSAQISGGSWVLRFSQARAYGQLTGYAGYDAGDEYISYSGPMTAGYRQRVAGGSSIYYDGSYTDSDGHTMRIANGATASMLSYTPFYARSYTDDKLFHTSFVKWFGSPYVPSFSATLSSQSAFPTTKAGQVVNVQMSYKNTGNVLWTDDVTAAGLGQFPVHLATANATNRNSAFGASWPSRARPALTFSKVFEADGTTLASNQHIVSPGQIAEYDFAFTVPVDYAAGTYQETFFPVREGTSSWFMGGTSWLNVTVQPTTYAATFSGQAGYPTLLANNATATYFDFKNTGTGTWYDESSHPTGIAPIHLATQAPINRSSRFGASWASPSRPALIFSKVFEADGVTLASNQHIVSPGQIGRFSYSFTIPADTKAGNYREFFTPVVEGASNWNMGVTAWQDITVQPTSYTAAFVDQSNYPTLAKGASTTAFFRIKNTGSAIWQDSTSAPTGVSPVHLATYNPVNRSSVFAASGWNNTARPILDFSTVYESDGTTVASNQHMVLPGQIAKFSFALTASASQASGTYREFYAPILEGANNWYLGPTMWLDVTVQ